MFNLALGWQEQAASLLGELGGVHVNELPLSTYRIALWRTELRGKVGILAVMRLQMGVGTKLEGFGGIYPAESHFQKEGEWN